jgi:hypothetical protein
MAPGNCCYLSNKYVAEILPRGISNALFMFVGPDSIRDSSGVPEGKQIIGVEEFSAPTRFLIPCQREGRGWSHSRYQVVKEDFSLDI